MNDLFAGERRETPLGEGAVLLGGFAASRAPEFVAEIGRIADQAPFRHLMTPNGGTMSVAMTNCGPLGWVSDRRGYRYEPADPLSGRNWPAMPPVFATLAREAAAAAGFAGFAPDACLINRYLPGARMGLHQDRDEAAVREPIVSVSLGLPAIFLWGGLARSDRTRRLALVHGDVVVWGGPSRMVFHGVAPLRDGDHPGLGAVRINMTFRRAKPIES